jgi:hypothetical protein
MEEEERSNEWRDVRIGEKKCKSCSEKGKDGAGSGDLL